MINMALIGAGRIGQVHGKNIVRSEKFSLTAIADAIPAAAQDLSETLKVPVQNIDQVFDDSSIDAILIATSTDTHADFIERAAHCGKAVFCEKPVDLAVERVIAAKTAVDKAKIPVMLGFNRRFDPHFAALKERIDQGVVGDIELVCITSRDPAAPPVDYIKKSGGLFRDMMIHDLDMARFLLGEEFTEVHSVGSALTDTAIGEAGDVDTAAVILKTASGKICQISNSRRATYGYDQRIEVHGSQGMLQAGNVPETTVSFAGKNGIMSDPVKNFFLERYEQAYANILESFADALTQGTKTFPDMYDGLQAQYLADAATQSCFNSKAVLL